MPFQEIVDSPENLVGLGVAAASRPPGFNNTCGVAKDLYASKNAGLEDGSSEEFHTEGCRPPEGVHSGLPVWEETPGAPSVLNDNAEANR